MYGSLIDALPAVLSLGNFAAVVLGVITGICIGALPGLSATMAISVLIPFTFGMDPLVALGMMAGIYNGAMYGGAIPAVLLRIPGTPAAVATSFDGYPMAQQGRGGYALQVSVVSSAIGGIVSAIVLMLLAPPLAKVTLLFGPSEVFWVAVFGLSAIVFLLGGDVLKGLLSACFGVFVSLVGLDSISGYAFFGNNTNKVHLRPPGVTRRHQHRGAARRALRHTAGNRPPGGSRGCRHLHGQKAQYDEPLESLSEHAEILEDLAALFGDRRVRRHPARRWRINGGFSQLQRSTSRIQ